MSIVVVGINHKTSPISLLERLTIPHDALPKALHQLAGYDHVEEGVVLSTCNRVEAYASVTRFHGGAQDLRNFFSECCHVPPEDFADHIYTYFDDGAVGHLFRVATGIDSLVVGESEILGQVRKAFQHAESEGQVGRNLRRAFTQALRVGKRARTETAIGRNPVSVSSAAVELARRAFPGERLEGKRVAVVGAGEMGRLALGALMRAGATDATVVNRGPDRAREVAEAFGVTSRPLEDISEVLEGADIVIASTTAPGVILDRATVEGVMERRPDRRLFVVDIAVPRDADPEIAELNGVVLRDITDLSALVDTNLGGRVDELGKVEDIVAAEITAFGRWERASEVAPLLARIVARADEVRSAEIERMRSELGGLDEDQREAVEQLTRRIVRKLLHTPMSNSRELAGSSAGHLYAEVLSELFGLDDEPGS